MYNKSWKSWIKHFDFIVIDMLALQISFALAFLIRHGMNNPWSTVTYRRMSLTLALLDFFIILFNDSMKNVTKRGYYQELSITFRHMILVELLSVLFLFFFQMGEDYSRIVLIITGVIYLFLSYMTRIIWKKMLKRSSSFANKRSLFIVSSKEFLPELEKEVKKNSYWMYKISGIVLIQDEASKNGLTLFSASPDFLMDIPVITLSDKADIYDLVVRRWVDEVYMKLPADSSDVMKFAEQFTEMGVVTHIELMHLGTVDNENQFVEKIGENTVLTVSLNTATLAEQFLKRLFDILGGVIGCFITLILCVVLGPVIYFSSPGPIFFTQERIGKNGRKFQIYKFRSMVVDAEDRKADLMKENKISDGRMFKLDFDPRIIGNRIMPDGTCRKGIGSFIREYSLDEFPQFFNVLKGDMSLVGTRPPTVEEWEQYEYHHRARMAVKPGITGLWQVSGRSNITDFEEVVSLDMKYIKNWSMGLDFRILLKTVNVVWKKEGSF